MRWIRALRRLPGAVAVALSGLVLWTPAPLLSNGGTLRLADALVAGYRVNVFTDPTPVRPDSVDVSVLVTEVDGFDPVEGLAVRVRYEPLGMDAPGGTLPATKEAADSPRYYAAKFRLGAVGRWRITVGIEEGGTFDEASFEVVARQAGILDRPVVILLLALAPLLLVTWWLRRNGDPRPAAGGGEGLPGSGGPGAVPPR